MTTDTTETATNQAILQTKYGPVTLTAHGDTATLTAGCADQAYADQYSSQPHIVINRIPYSFTAYLEWEHETYNHEPVDEPRWIRTRSTGIYIRRLDTQYGMGEPTRQASSTIYGELIDLAIEYLTAHPRIVLAGKREHLRTTISNLQRDLDRHVEEMNAIHDKITEAGRELASL